MFGLRTRVASLLFVATAVLTAQAIEISQAEWEQMKRDIEELRKSKSAAAPIKTSAVDKAVASKYGPNAPVTTKSGKLTISGLVQVWYYSIENDNEGLFNDPIINGVVDTNETLDNDSFRIRRTELKFTMDIHENIRAVVMIDPSREAGSFPGFSSNTATIKRGAATSAASSVVTNVQGGAATAGRALQDAYIQYHGVVPHHDFYIGQYKPFIGEEGIRSSSQLDFVERSMIGQLGDARDIGLTVHGKWWKERFQYWFGAFNSPGNFFGSAGQFQNRSDDNDEKGYTWRLLVRPLWDEDECDNWGKLELGYSGQWAIHGESGAQDPINGPIAGLNRRQNDAIRHYAWMSYFAPGALRGLWLRGEWASIKDRHAPNAVFDVVGGTTGTYDAPNPFSINGWYAALGYHIGKSRFASSCPSWLNNLEFAARYETFDNVHVADLINPESQTDTFATDIWTIGVNYYIQGHNAKIQLNYNIVDNPDEEANNAARRFNAVKNDSVVLNFQVAW